MARATPAAGAPATPEVIITRDELLQSFIDAGLIKELPDREGLQGTPFIVRRSIRLFSKEDTTWDKFINTSLSAFNGKSMRDLLSQDAIRRIKSAFDDNQISQMAILTLQDLGAARYSANYSEYPEGAYQLTRKTLAKMYPAGIPEEKVWKAPAAAAASPAAAPPRAPSPPAVAVAAVPVSPISPSPVAAAGPAALPPRVPSPPAVAVAAGPGAAGLAAASPAALPPRVPSPVVAPKRTGVMLTYDELMFSFSMAGLISGPLDEKRIIRWRAADGMSWKEFEKTPLPVFNGKTLGEMMPELVSELQHDLESGRVDEMAYRILGHVGKQVSVTDWELSPDTLRRMYPDARGIAEAADAARARVPRRDPRGAEVRAREDVDALWREMQGIKSTRVPDAEKIDDILKLTFRGQPLGQALGGRQRFDVGIFLSARAEELPVVKESLKRVLCGVSPALALGAATSEYIDKDELFLELRDKLLKLSTGGRVNRMLNEPLHTLGQQTLGQMGIRWQDVDRWIHSPTDSSYLNNIVRRAADVAEDRTADFASLAARGLPVAPARDDMTHLLNNMRMIRRSSNPIGRKLDDTLDLLYKGERLGDLLGGRQNFNVETWLNAREAQLPDLERQLRGILEERGPAVAAGAAAARGGAPARAESPGGESPGRGRRSPSPEGGLGASSPRAGGAAAGGSAGRPGFNRGAFKQELADFLAELGRQSGRVNAIRDHRFNALGNRTPLQVGITGTDINNWLQQRPAAIAIPDLDSFVDQVAEVAARGTPARAESPGGESPGRGRRSPSADGGHGAWSPRAGGAAAGGSAGRSDFNREAFRREFAEFLRSLGPGGGRVSKIEKNKFATLGNRSPEDVGINGTQIDAWLRQRRTEDAIADLDSFVEQVAEVAARGTPARAPSPGAVRRSPSPVGAGHRAPSPGPAAAPPRVPITPAVPERDDITELLLNMSMIKKAPGGTIEDIRRLQFRGHTLADALFGKPFDLQRWMDADPARQLPIEERLRRLLSSPAVAAGPARAPSPGAVRRPPSPVGAGLAAAPPRAPSPVRGDIRALLAEMQGIKDSAAPSGKTDAILQLPFRGSTLKAVLGGRQNFDVQRWLRADKGAQPAIEIDLISVLEERSPAAAGASPRAPSPGAARADLPVPHTPAVGQEQKPGWGRRAWGWFSGR